MPDPTPLASEPLTVPGEPIVAAGWEPRASRSANALPPGTRVNEFEILEPLGEGGFGIVYRARDHSLQRTVALKEYMPVVLAGRTEAGRVSVRSGEHVPTFLAGMRSFINEAQLLAQFDHEALVKVHRFCEANGTAYMAMPLYEGGTLKQALRERVARGVAADESWLRALLAPLLDALALLHRENCLHRDIAPDNILLLGGDLPAPRPVLLDFGAARRVIGEQTQALTVILKPGFAPIEQYDEIPGMKQGPWTDLYALGAVLHFAIAGQPPPPSVRRAMLDTHEPLATMAAQLPSRYGTRFLVAIDRALAPLPGDRPQDVAAWRDMLAEDGRPEPASRARPHPAPARRAAPVRASVDVAPRRAPALVKWAGVALAVGVGFLYLSKAPAPADAPPAGGEPVATPAVPPPQSQAPAPAPADAGPTAAAPSVDLRPQQTPLRPRSRLGAPAYGDGPDPGPHNREPAIVGGGPVPPEDEERLANAPAWVREKLREARLCLVARRYTCTIEHAEAVLKDDPGQPVAQRLARLGREGLGGGWRKR